MRLILGLAVAMLAAAANAAPLAPHHLIPGGVYDGKGPDGNTIILDAPEGLIVVDTGRHPDHAAKILSFVKSTGKPVAAIINSHWHFDHSTGNRELLDAYPNAKVVASKAIDGQLYRGFAAQSRAGAEAYLKSGNVSAEQRAEIERGFRAMDNLQLLRPAIAVTASAPIAIAGRTLDVRLAPFAVSEGDVWLVVPEEKMVIAGDLVVDIVPFMDTACVEGWSKALEDISAVDFETLIPGHGAPMSKPEFIQWKTAFGALVDCGRTSAAVSECVEGWMTNAAPFIAQDKKAYVREAAAYYLESRLRSKPDEQRRFCAVPKG